MTQAQLILAIIQRRKVIAIEVKECNFATEDTVAINLVNEFDFLRQFQFKYSKLLNDQENDLNP